MTIDFTGFHKSWAIISTFFGSMGWQNWLFWLITAPIIGAALFQMIRHIDRRYWKIMAAAVLAVAVGYGVFVAVADHILPKLAYLTISGQAVVATLIATAVSLVILWLLTRPILHPGSRAKRGKRKARKTSLVTQMGHFGTTAAGPSDSNWTSDRAIRDEMLDSFRPNDLHPTRNEFEKEFNLRRQRRDQRQNH